MRKHGRPKGAEKTVIGPPCRKRQKTHLCNKVTPFLRKSPQQKEEG